MSIVSNNIKYLRRLHGLTQEQFSRRIGIKRSLLGAYEESRANPNLDNLMTMARTFNVTVDQLLKSDLRKIRETPNLSFPDKEHAASSSAIKPPIPKEVEPQTLEDVFDQFYTPPSTTPKPQQPTVNWSPRPVPEPPKPPAPEPVVQTVVSTNVFNNNFDTSIPSTISNTTEIRQPKAQQIQIVKLSQMVEYISKCQNAEYISQLPIFQLPFLPDGHYRAFEAGDDFAFKGGYLIAQFVKNWYDIVDGKNYVLIARGLGAVYRRIYNQVKIKGTLLLTSDLSTIPTFEIPIKEVMEVWEVKSFFSTTLPEPTVSLEHFRHLVGQMQEELDRIKK